jgi:uncharacterized protein DUF4386
VSSTKAAARCAGVLYLLTGMPGWFSYMYIPMNLMVTGDAAATARKVAGMALMYRAGIVSDLFGQIVLVFLVLSLYHLLKDADRRSARLMVTLVAIGVAFQVANVLNLMAPLVLWSGADFLSAFTKPQLDALALAFLRLRGDALFVSQIFWGLWLFPFGVLVIKSGLFPKLLGVLLIVACCGYVAASGASILLPMRAHVVLSLGQGLGAVGEGTMILWLLVVGAREPAPEARFS